MFSFFFCDSAQAWQLGFQDTATPIADGILRFHHDLIFILILVVVFVSWILVRILARFSYPITRKASSVVHGTTIEIIWTLVPAFLLIIIAVPSFALLYSVDEVVNPAVTLKIVGHQWYWSYEYSDLVFGREEAVFFDSYIVAQEDLSVGDLRLLEVDSRLVLPVCTHIRLVVTSSDVLHSWTVPSFGVKMDACPGRLNEASVFIQRPGVFYGQCSEICGVNHGFIPIAVEVLSLSEFTAWLASRVELCFLAFQSFFFFLLFFFCCLAMFQKNVLKLLVFSIEFGGLYPINHLRE